MKKDSPAIKTDRKTVPISKEALSVLLPALAYLNEISKLDELPDAIAHLHRLGVNAVFNSVTMPDFEKSNQSIIHVTWPGSLGLPERHLYLDDDEYCVKHRERYVDHIASMFEQFGERPWHASQHAKAAMRIETALATASKSEAKQNLYKLMHEMSVVTFEQLIPSLSHYFEKLGEPSFDGLNVQLDYFQELDLLFTTVPIVDWKAYLRWHVIYDIACQKVLPSLVAL